jgi:calcineurin-like phosphoesterase family protein
MGEAMIERWNKVVRPKDKVYNLGDVVINRKALKTLGRLNGDKVLIRGNHDIFKLRDYTPYFRDVRGVGVIDKFILTHIPVHPASLGRWEGNFHGHLHSNRVMRKDSPLSDVVDERYLCLCVEHTDFTPISLEDAKKRFMEQQ